MRDIHNFNNQFEYFKNKLNSDNSISDKQKEDFARFLQENQSGKSAKVRVGVARLSVYTSYFQMLCKYFKKDLSSVTEKDIDKFVSDLDNDKIRSRVGKPYSNDTKNEFIKLLKKYLAWHLEDEVQYKKLIGWVKKYGKGEEKPVLKLEEINLLSLKAPNEKISAENMTFFDSGARASELLNAQIKQLEKRTKKSGGFVYILHIKGTKTKEADRKIALPLATKYLKKWLSIHPNKDDPNSLIFPDSYHQVVRDLKALARKVLNKEIPIHSYRHSSATYYAEKLKGAPSFYYRLGWTMFSPQGRRYVRKAIYEEEAQDETTNIIESDKVEKLETNLEKAMEVIKHLTEASGVNFDTKLTQKQRQEKIVSIHNKIYEKLK